MQRNTDIITADIVDAAYRIHAELGPGLRESVYERVLMAELVRRGYQVDRQVAVSFEYDGMVFAGALTLDLLVNRCVVVEIKACEQTRRIHQRQTFTYIRVMGLEVGLLLNFGAVLMKDGIRRVVNNYRPSPESRLRINAPPGRERDSR